MNLRHTGTLTRVTKENSAFMFDQITGKVLPFPFTAIANYEGQTAEDLGLEAGLQVTYDTDTRGKVTQVQVPPKASRRKPRTFLVEKLLCR